jgi:class 3 adenylate cyclase
MAESKAGEIEQELNAEQLLAERLRLDALFAAKFNRTISVMFTDLKDSTAITEREGNLTARALMKRHNDIFFPLIEQNGGVLVKTMGDGTLSYYESAQSAAQTAVSFQSALRNYNLTHKPKIPIEVTIGIHTGEGIVEANDIFGDVVNVAARFQSQADAGEILVSQDTFDALQNRSDIYCRYVRMAQLKGKSDAFKIFKIFWDPADIASDKAQLQASEVQGAAARLAVRGGLPRPSWRLLLFFVSLIAFLGIVMVAMNMVSNRPDASDTRSLRHKVNPESK